VCGLAEGDVSKERVDCSQPHVAGSGAVALFALEMVEKFTYEWRIKLVDCEL
jgi:hypothetical protein